MEKIIAILGGTGAEGLGLALRWAQAGLRIRIGSRDPGKAAAAAAKVKQAVPGANAPGLVEGLLNPEAAALAEIVVLTVPLLAQIPTIQVVRDHLRPGAIFVDTTVPVGASLGDRVSHLVLPWAGSAAQQGAGFLPGHVSAVSAFHSLSAVALADLAHPVESDVLICGDSAEAKAVVKELAEKIPGVRAVDAGLLENSRFAEHAAALLIALNVRHKLKHCGLRLTGLFPPGG